MTLRKYTESDCREMSRLFYDTVHSVNAADYDDEQLNAWATGEVDLKKWNASFIEHFTVVAEKNGVIIGFGDMDDTGYLDRLYVHRDYQRMGVAASICNALENEICAREYTVHASITARPFFEKIGYAVIKKQQVERFGVMLTNYIMKK